MENSSNISGYSADDSTREPLERYGYLPEILHKLTLTLQQYGEEHPELKTVERQMQDLLERTGQDSRSFYSCLQSLMRILRTAQFHSQCGRLLYLRVLGDIANAQGKPVPKHSGKHYLDVLP